MKKLIAFAVGHPITVCMVVVAVLLLGKISYDRLSVDLLPDLNTPRLYIELKAEGRPPQEIEQLFVKEIEATAVRQNNVTEVSSIIRAGSAQISVSYDWEKDMDEAYLDLQKAIAPFQLREGVTSLSVLQHDLNTAPVLLVSLTHDRISDMSQLRRIAEGYVRNELIRVDGVADVVLSGDQYVQLQIDTDPYKLAAFGLTLSDIAARIEANNKPLSGGKVSEMGIQYLVKSISAFSGTTDFENLIVGYKSVQPTQNQTQPTQESNQEKAPIYLRELATVRFLPVEPDNIVRIDGQRTIGLLIYKEPRSNTVRVVDAVEEHLSKLQQGMPAYHFRVITDQGVFVKEAIGEVQESALMGIVLAVIVLFVFLRRWGTTLIVSLAIPISIVATFNLMFFNGLTLNIMTLGGLALGAGMLVDNAIVVIENIFRNRESGRSTHESAIAGTAEVGGAVTASTLTTLVVFLPIVYLHGASGELFKDQAWTVAFSLLSSLAVALLVIPMLYTRLARDEKRNATHRSVEINGYGNWLRTLLKYPGRVVVGAAIVLLVSLALLPFIGTEFMPRAMGRDFSVSLKLPEGSLLERTDAAAAAIEAKIRSVVGDSLVSIYTHVGAGSGSGNALFEGDHTAVLRVKLAPESPYSASSLMELLDDQKGVGNGITLSLQQEEHSLSALMGTEDAPVVVEVRGEELEEISRITEEVKRALTPLPGLFNVATSVEEGAPELIIHLNRTLTGIYNISTSTVVDQLREQLSGKNSGKMETAGEMCDIVIRTPALSRAELENVIVKSGTQNFRLGEIATIRTAQAPREIFRRNQHRIGKVTAGLESGYSLDKVAQTIDAQLTQIELPAGYTLTITGEEEQRRESLSTLLFALLLSVILVYMVLASQFESLLHPFTILLTIPLAGVGSLWLFFLTGTPLGVMGVIGIVMLCGIAVNNSILLVDRIGQLKAERSLQEAIVAAGSQRIRPILMTTLTTILALIPMSLQFGEGASLRSPMALAVVGGLITSTLMSLIVVPALYLILERTKEKLSKKRAA